MPVSMNYQDFSSPSPKNLSSRRTTQFTLRFIQALERIKMTATTSPALRRTTVHQRSRMIKLASYSSMASTVGSRRLWSRVMLLKIKKRARLHGLKMASLRKNKKKKKKITKRKMNIRRKVGSKYDESGCERLGRTAALRRLIPGGESMEFCRLLEETADYIKCLNTQVQVMQRIAEVCTP